MTRSMRIACLHIPQYALQCASRVDPSLRGPAAGAGAAIAMVDAQGPSPRLAAGSGPLHAPVVVACSRAAWALGVRLGMTAPAARSISSEISVDAVDAAAVREAEGTGSGPTAISIVAKRIARRLEGRGRGAARVELVATTGEGARTIVPDFAAVAELGVAAAAAQAALPGHISQRATPAITSAELLSRAFAQVLEVPGEATTWRLRATVIGEAVTVMAEHEVAVTNEYAMPVRTIDAIAVAPVMQRAC